MAYLPTLPVLAERSTHRNTTLKPTCLLCEVSPEMATQFWTLGALFHKSGAARQHLVAWLDTYAGPVVAPVCRQVWEPTVVPEPSGPGMRSPFRFGCSFFDLRRGLYT